MKLEHRYSSEELLEGCKAGNRKSQELLYKNTAGKMMGVCMRYAKDRFEAEDMLQMSYVKIFQKIDEFRGDGSFEGWMRRVVVNTSIELYRKNKRSLTVVDIDEAYDQPSVNLDLGNFNANDLLNLVQKLAEGYRMVFNMYAIEGYSHREIAELLGITEGASKSQLSRARAILKEQVLKMERIGYASRIG